MSSNPETQQNPNNALAERLGCGPDTAAFIARTLGNEVHQGGSGLAEQDPGDAAGFTEKIFSGRELTDFRDNGTPRGNGIEATQRGAYANMLEGKPFTSAEASSDISTQDQLDATLKAVVGINRGDKILHISETNQLTAMDGGENTVAMGKILKEVNGQHVVVETAVVYGPSVEDPSSPTVFGNGKIEDFMVSVRNATPADFPGGNS